MNTFSLRTATWLGATVVAAGLLGTAGCSSSSSSSSSASASASSKTLTVKQIAFGTTLKHTFQPGGKGAPRTEHLTQPDDIVTLGGKLYVGFQNGVGSQGEASGSGNLDSTLVEFTPAGSVVKQWDVTGKIDGMGADSATGQVIVTVNEDSKSSLYTVSGGTVTHYTYTPSPLPQLGGTDAVAVYSGKILVSASAPGTSGKAPASAPAVFAVTLNAGAKTAAVAPFFADNATATGVNAASASKKVTLALTDPDSNGVVPSNSPKFARDFMLNSQGDQELIFSGASGQNLQVLKISKPVERHRLGDLSQRFAVRDRRRRRHGRCHHGLVHAGDRVYRGGPVQRQQRPDRLPYSPRLPGQLPGHDQPEDRCGRQRRPQRADHA